MILFVRRDHFHEVTTLSHLASHVHIFSILAFLFPPSLINLLLLVHTISVMLFESFVL
jgi:hypothetical protein